VSIKILVDVGLKVLIKFALEIGLDIRLATTHVDVTHKLSQKCKLVFSRCLLKQQRHLGRVVMEVGADLAVKLPTRFLGWIDGETIFAKLTSTSMLLVLWNLDCRALPLLLRAGHINLGRSRVWNLD
jgi:hypothetical protein